MQKRQQENPQILQKIKTIGKNLFYEKGYERTLYDDIGRIGQMNCVLISNYYKQKSKLAQEVYDAFLEEFKATRDQLVQEDTLLEQLVFSVLYYYKLLEQEPVARFVEELLAKNVLTKEGADDEVRLLFGEAQMYRELAVKREEMEDTQWREFLHLVWGMETEKCRCLYGKYQDACHDGGEQMLLLVLQYLGYEAAELESTIKEMQERLQQYTLQVTPEFTIVVTDKNGKVVITSETAPDEEVVC